LPLIPVESSSHHCSFASGSVIYYLGTRLPPLSAPSGSGTGRKGLPPRRPYPLGGPASGNVARCSANCSEWRASDVVGRPPRGSSVANLIYDCFFIHGQDWFDTDEGVGRADDHCAEPFVAQGRQKVSMRARILSGRRATGPVHPAQGRHQRLRRPVLSVPGARYEGPKTFGERMMALTANRRDPTIYRSGTEVDMTPPGRGAAMIAVAVLGRQHSG